MMYDIVYKIMYYTRITEKTSYKIHSMISVYVCIVIPNLERSTFLRTQPRQFDQPNDISRTFRLHRHITLSCQRFRELNIKGGVGKRLNVRTRFASRLAIVHCCQGPRTLFWFDTKSGIAWFFPSFQLIFLAIEMKLRSGQPSP